MKKIKELLPKKVLNSIRFIKNFGTVFGNYLYDALRFLKYSFTIESNGGLRCLEARIIAHCHVIEKGMSLKEPRLGYGKEVIQSLINLLEVYVNKEYPKDNFAFMSAVSALEEYVDFHEKRDWDVSELKMRIDKFEIWDGSKPGGAVELSKQDILKSSKSDFYDFSQNRYSIRNYRDDPVDLGLLKRAIEIAQKSPSVCNRQSSRVYIIQDKNYC